MGFVDVLRIETISADSRRVEVRMPIADEVLQPHGYVHGGATIALLETAASMGAECCADLATQRPFGVDVHVRHRKGTRSGHLLGVAELECEEISERTGFIKQVWSVAAYDDAGDVVSEGEVVTKIVSLARLAVRSMG